MNLTEMYVSSPDWLKLTWTLAPWVTVYAVARIWGRVAERRADAVEDGKSDWVEVKRVDWE